AGAGHRYVRHGPGNGIEIACRRGRNFALDSILPFFRRAGLRTERTDVVRRSYRLGRGHLYRGELRKVGLEDEVCHELVFGALSLYPAARGCEAGCADVDQIVACAGVEAETESARAVAGRFLHESIRSACHSDAGAGYCVRRVVGDSATDHIGAALSED